MPKKGSFEVLKCHGHITMIAVDKQLLFFQEWDGPWFPTLRLVHRFPNLLPRLQVDKGAIKFVLSGANIMSPGLTSPGADLGEAEVEAGQPVVSCWSSLAFFFFFWFFLFVVVLFAVLILFPVLFPLRVRFG